jgi:hypothetical protein
MERKEEISLFSSHYNVRIRVHPNELIASLTEPPIQRRLRRYWPDDLLAQSESESELHYN